MLGTNLGVCIHVKQVGMAYDQQPFPENKSL